MKSDWLRLLFRRQVRLMTRNQESQWTEQQDLLLGQTILTHLENNGTQLGGISGCRPYLAADARGMRVQME